MVGYLHAICLSNNHIFQSSCLWQAPFLPLPVGMSQYLCPAGLLVSFPALRVPPVYLTCFSQADLHQVRQWALHSLGDEVLGRGSRRWKVWRSGLSVVPKVLVWISLTVSHNAVYSHGISCNARSSISDVFSCLPLFLSPAECLSTYLPFQNMQILVLLFCFVSNFFLVSISLIPALIFIISLFW